MVGMTMQHLNERTQIIPTHYALKESVCQKLWQGHKVMLPELGDFEFNAPKEVPYGMVDCGRDSEFAQKVSKALMKDGEEKGVNSVYPLDWFQPKNEKQKSKIMIKGEIFMGTEFIKTREATEGTCPYLKDPLKQDHTFFFIKVIRLI